VICHNDFAPYNLIFDGQKPVALIDFDVAGPGPRLRDVAMGAYWFTPLSFSSDLTERSMFDIRSGGQRLRLFCEAYGLELTFELVDMVEEWLLFMSTFPVEQVENGHAEYQKLIDEGHVDHWRREYHAFCEYRFHIDNNLKRKDIE
jgi:aminoglycoside phosphotransferase (APT) family kinase protein